MENQDVNGIYSSVTSLCEKFSRDPYNIKKLRSKCYEILLKKRAPHTQKYKNLSTDDPICNLNAWQYVLWSHFKMHQTAQRIVEYHKYLQESYGNSNSLDTYHDTLKFLLCLRDVPQIEDENINLSIVPQCEFDLNFNKLFKLNDKMLDKPISNTLFYFKSGEMQTFVNGFHEKKSSACLLDESESSILINKEIEEIIRNEKDSELDDIWEIAAREEYNDRKNWENYGLSEPEKEPIFLSELGDLSSLWTDNLQSHYLPKLLKNGIVLRPEVIRKRKFIRDLKYLLIGMASETFTYNDFGEFILIPDKTLEGITADTLEIFVKDFTSSGTCYKSLFEMSSQDPYTNKYKCNGYIFAEFCESLNKYLQFYSSVVMGISDDMNPLEFSDKTGHLRKQIITLASICRVGLLKENEEIPHGVDLLNYLYSKITQTTDKKLALMLYSILYPCTQIYFGHFISQWILDGSVHDPYNEFFIKTNYKFVTTRGRTYWTRSFEIYPDLIPEFLQDLKDNILQCGKMMNLLKLCHPFNKLSVFLMGKKPQIISCCVTRNQLIALHQNAQTYFIEASEACGPKISLEFILQKEKEMSGDLLNLISKKRTATLKRIELERQKTVQESYEKKLEERTMLKEQYDIALQQKQFNMLQEIENEIKVIETDIQIEERNEELVQREAKDLIDYYEELFKISDAKREQIEKHIEVLKNYHLDSKHQHQFTESMDSKRKLVEPKEEIPEPELPQIRIGDAVEIEESIESHKSLDELNANCEEPQEIDNIKSNSGAVPENNNFKETLDNFAQARRNRMKVLNEELGITSAFTYQRKNTNNTNNKPEILENLSDAQKNKMKVMSSEFDIDYRPTARERVDKKITSLDINKFRMMNSTIFYDNSYNPTDQNDNNKTDEGANPNENRLKTKSLSLNFSSMKDCVENVEKCLPMSVDSTPLSEIASSISTITKIQIDNDKMNCDSFPTTACTEMTDDGVDVGFKFKEITPVESSNNKTQTSFVFSKIFPSEDVKNVEQMCLKMFLSESLSHSLAIQSSLVQNELLKYFIFDLKYLNHLNNLKNYFFLQDGEFGNSLTETLFNKLYSAKTPSDLLNFRVLSSLLHNSLEDTKSSNEFSRVSFKINSVPENFNLGNVDVLYSLSFTYKVEWPLNILLPCDTLAKYNDVFKFLLKINRMNWVLKKIFLNLRMFAKQSGKKEQYLMMSVHFRKIQQFRYFMMHFVQTFQNYITGEVLQSQWVLFENNLKGVKTLDEIYEAHTQYIKNILFMCLLNQRSAPLKTVIDKIFTVILKFYDKLRSKRWKCENGQFLHPNFDKLQSIFDNFNEFIEYLFKIGAKVVRNGYQPQFKYFLNSLNSNNFYVK